MTTLAMKMPSIQPRNHGLSVYVVEDDDFFAELLLDVLSVDRRVEKVMRFTDGQEAAEFLTDGDWPDLFITDLSMPKSNGVSFLEFVRTAEIRGEVFRNGQKVTKRDTGGAAIPVVVLTNSDKATDYSQVVTAKANCFVTKPDSLDELRLVLKRVIRSIIWSAPLPSILDLNEPSDAPTSTLSMLSRITNDIELKAFQALPEVRTG